MRTDGTTIRENEMVTPHLDLEAVKEWAKRTFSKDRIAEAGLLVATVVVTGYFGTVLYQAIQNYSISGF